MRYSVAPSWSEWKRWTDYTDEELAERMAECLNSPKVREFMEAFGEYLDYCRVAETNRHMADPKRQQRTYCEALRDIRQKLADITKLHIGEYYVGNTGGGVRRR